MRLDAGTHHPRGPHEAAKPAMNQHEAKMRPLPYAGSLGCEAAIAENEKGENQSPEPVSKAGRVEDSHPATI